jgi:hypothetical protein
MNAESVPLPTPEDLATERLVAAVESAIAGLQERLANIATDGQDAKWSVSDLVKLLQLRDQLHGERPRTIFAYWVDNPPDPSDRLDLSDNNNDDQHEYNGAKI